MAAILAFVVAASVGAVAALMVSGNASGPQGERPRPEEPNTAGEQGNNPPQRQQADADRQQQEHQQKHTDRSQQAKAGAKREPVVSLDKQTSYVEGVGEIQARSVEVFSDSHEKLLHYDILTAGDIAKMQANQAALKGFADQASDLKAPQKYTEQKDVFVSAINDLHQAAQLAYALAAEPVSATQDDFDHYDRLVDEAAAHLQRSNDILGKDYKTIEGLRGVNTR
ncbi:MAG: hypothetical protein M3272_07835 [Actinomycetota bacterium]|nr:hypothetical protein [Actinomycetota bacterium]